MSYRKNKKYAAGMVNFVETVFVNGTGISLDKERANGMIGLRVLLKLLGISA